MTEIERKALALVNEVAGEEDGEYPAFNRKHPYGEALCRAIEQHEAFRREVSKVITDLTCIQHQYTFARGAVLGHLEKFVLKEPVDPLVEALTELEWCNTDQLASDLRAALAARGLKIVEDKP